MVPPAKDEIIFFDFYSIIYMFEFADMIKLNIGCSLDHEAKKDKV